MGIVSTPTICRKLQSGEGRDYIVIIQGDNSSNKDVCLSVSTCMYVYVWGGVRGLGGF